MAQTPARDFIKAAEVDFRFYRGDLRNHANTAHALTYTGAPAVATIQPVHGVLALTAVNGAPDQTWMVAAQTAMTFESLISLDMMHLGTGDSPAESSALLWGDWKISFAQIPGAGETSTIRLALAFNGDGFGGTYYVYQNLSGAVTQSMLKGSLLHLAVSARYTAGTTTLEVTTCVNGWYATSSVASADHAMIAAPTNALFDTPVVFSPAYLVRMWASYQADAQVLADLYREAQRVLPAATFPAVTAGSIQFNGIA